MSELPKVEIRSVVYNVTLRLGRGQHIYPAPREWV